MEQHRLDKLEKIKAQNKQPYVNYHKKDHDITDVVEKYKDVEKDALPEHSVIFDVAGRIIAMREFGKTAFMTIKDRTGSIQIYVKKGEISDDDHAIFKTSDVGDIIGIKGFLFKTKTGELTLCATEYKMLTKALRDLPEKFHGLTDVEKRYRQRYVDLIVNDEVKDTFRKRSQIIQQVRQFFISKDFLEVETPMMHPIVGGATAKPFETHHNALDMPLYLRIAPELYLKRLVIGGLERVFEVNRNFRNEGLSTRHNPEFTMIEWYNAYNDYHGLMDQIEEMICDISEKVNGSLKINFRDKEVDLTRPWKRITMNDAITSMTEVTPDQIADRETPQKSQQKNTVFMLIKTGERVRLLWKSLKNCVSKIYSILLSSLITLKRFLHWRNLRQTTLKPQSALSCLSAVSSWQTDLMSLTILWIRKNVSKNKWQPRKQETKKRV